MKRSNDETARARYEDVLRHQGRAARAASARHVSRRQSEQKDAERESEPEAEPNRVFARDSANASAGTAASTTPGTTAGVERPSRFENRMENRSERRGGSRVTPIASGTLRASGGEVESEDAGTARLETSRRRRAQQKMRAATLLLVIPTTAFSLMLMAMAHVVFRDWRSYESEASIARAQLSGLQEQFDSGQRRLKALRSEKGREQILIEHAYVRPGDRLLLFPKEDAPEARASQAQNEISARRSAIRNGASSSAWDRAARAMTGWLGSLSGSATPAPGAVNNAAPRATPQPSAAPNAEAAQGEDVSPEERIVAPSAGGEG